MPSGPRALAWLLGAAALVGVWTILAGDASVPELLAAVVAATAAMAVGVLAHRHSGLEHRPDPLLLARLPALLWHSIVDVGWCARVLVDRTGVGGARDPRLRPRWLRIAFDATGDDPASVARRVAIAVTGSFAATTYVAAVDVDRGTVLVHRLAETGRDPLPIELLDPA